MAVGVSQIDSGKLRNSILSPIHQDRVVLPSTPFKVNLLLYPLGGRTVSKTRFRCRIVSGLMETGKERHAGMD